MIRHSLDSCGCSQVDVAPARRFASSLTVQKLAHDLPDRARIYPGAGVIQVGGPWWDSLNVAQRACILAHERAHEEQQRETCESCIDMRAGAILRHEGWSRDAVVDGFRSTVRSREAGRSAGIGWDAADGAIARGLAVREVPAAIAELRNDPDAGPDELAAIADAAAVPSAAPAVVDAGDGSFFDSKLAGVVVVVALVVAVVLLAKKM